MDFGFGLGDFITIIQLVNDVRRRFVNAPSQFNAVSNEYVGINQDAQGLVQADKEQC